LKLVF